MDIIRQIINMDKAAAKKCEEAVVQQRKALDASGEKAASEREKAIAERRKALEEYKARESAKLNEKLSRAEDYRAEQCRKLDDAFDAGRDRWKDEILSRITEG